jgi:hypothetical protein
MPKTLSETKNAGLKIAHRRQIRRQRGKIARNLDRNLNLPWLSASGSIATISLNQGHAIMIPAIALMIAVYGSARLLNDGCKRHPTSNPATIVTWIVSILAIIGLWILVFLINFQGVSSSNLL